MSTDTYPIEALIIQGQKEIPASTLMVLKEYYNITSTIAIGADEGLHILSTQSFDAVISDYEFSKANTIRTIVQTPMMDAMKPTHITNGIDLLKHQREIQTRTPPFILCMNNNDADTVIEAYHSGAAECINTTIASSQPEDIGERIRKVVHRERNAIILRASKKLLEATLDSIPDIIGIQKPDHSIVAYNKAGYAFLNSTPEEVKGKKCFELIGRTAPCEVCATTSALWTKQLERVEKYLPEFDIYLDCRSYPVLDDDGEVIFIVEQLSDITFRKRAEEEIRSISEEYQTVFNGTQDAMFLIEVLDDGSFRLKRTNQAHQNATGLSEEMIGGKTPADILGDDDGKTISANYQRCVEAGRSIMYEETLALPAGERTWETLLTPVSKDGRTAFIVGSSRDITEQRKAEAALRQVNKKLTLLSGITRHDILNQVMILLGNLEFVEDMAVDEQLHVYLNRIREAGTTIRQQIEFTRLYDNLGATDPIWQDVAETILQTKRNIIPIEIDLPALSIYADPMLEKVFSNLMDNTILHGERTTRVRINAQFSNGNLIICWEDNGIGIPESHKEKIFSRGYGKNTGLGLFLSREILEITGISIRETGVYGEGARFEIRVPEGAYSIQE